MTKRSATLALATLIAASIGAFLVLAWFLTFDGGGIRRGDLAYFIFVPAKVRDLPTLDACTEPVFANTTNDSLEAETVKMDYSSRRASSALLTAYEHEIASWSCTRVQAPEPGRIALQCANPSVEVKLASVAPRDEAGCQPMALEFRFSSQ